MYTYIYIYICVLQLELCSTYDTRGCSCDIMVPGRPVRFFSPQSRRSRGSRPEPSWVPIGEQWMARSNQLGVKDKLCILDEVGIIQRDFHYTCQSFDWMLDRHGDGCSLKSPKLIATRKAGKSWKIHSKLFTCCKVWLTVPTPHQMPTITELFAGKDWLIRLLNPKYCLSCKLHRHLQPNLWDLKAEKSPPRKSPRRDSHKNQQLSPTAISGS